MKKYPCLIILTFMINNLNLLAIGKTPSETLPLNWSVGHADHLKKVPKEWYPATVPGAVQLDMAKGLNYGSYFYAENWKDYLWMEDEFFTYLTSFNKPIVGEDQKCLFISKGIDYEFEIWLNGAKLFHQEGMFSTVRIDLTQKLLDKNELLVKIYPIPKIHQELADRSQASQSVKPAVSYGWDWHPRLVPSGIWDETYIVVRESSEITNVESDYTLDAELKSASLTTSVKGENLSKCHFELYISDDKGTQVLKNEGNFESNEISLKNTITNVNLWWPHDQGTPYLYQMIVRLLSPDGKLIQEYNSSIGFRKVQLVMNQGAWDFPKDLPKSRSIPPIQLEINGRKIFAKGTNWVNPEIFPGIITADRYNELLERAKEANFNILRVWGGGIINKDSFYELCDEKGILVWQEFPLACNNYEGTPHYLKILEQESESIIKRLKVHPSLALWCGGNELFNSWSKMTDQSLALRLLNSQCYRLDRHTPFLPTSPVMGMGHGHYVFLDWDSKEEVFQWMPRAHNSAYTEFGMPAPSLVEVLKTIIPEAELWPPKPGKSWESHHAYNAWQGNTWLCQDIIEDYFGTSTTLEQLVSNGQLIQGEGYKCIYEEARRQKPYCSMALNWCFNEPWPTAANNSIVNWPNIPKPGFYAVKNACRPVLSSARISKMKWKEGEIFSADIWILNDFYKDLPAGKMTIKLVADGTEIFLLTWEYNKIQANMNQSGPTIRYLLPSWKTNRMKLILEVEGHPEYKSEYTLAYQAATFVQKSTKIQLNQ